MTYNLKPEIPVSASALDGYGQIASAIKQKSSQFKKAVTILTVECYPGVNKEELKAELFSKLDPALVLDADDYTDTTARVQERIKDYMTDDRVFGIMSHYTIDQFLSSKKRQEAEMHILEITQGLVILFGFGATLLAEPDILIYADLTRWEIQCRFRYEKLTNWKTDNALEDALRKFKRGYFFEWRMADRQKKACFDRLDFLLDTNQKMAPKMVDGDAYRGALKQAVTQPFRLVPYFDASVWGGQWMKKNFALDPTADNFGWAFDGVPEENSLLFNFDGTKVEIPAINLVFSEPDDLLGPSVHARFGTEFPIRFDYLDTMGGGNLSLQVHPRTEYIQEQFGMPYTQDESYYILQATDRSTIYLGVKEDATLDELSADLKRAEAGGYRFPDEKYINEFPVRKHDHISIPAGTIHCGGPDTVVLEISATPYIFTFKLWDWGRTGLDGIPRPVHINHGVANIDITRDTAYVEQNLIVRADQPFENLAEQSGVRSERTGLHELEFIETERHWLKDSATLSTHGSVNMLNLVEGNEAAVESLDGTFPPFIVHYGETFIVPAAVGKYRIRHTKPDGTEIAVIQAFVR
ncbi:class I mannose-6-phosphate isomerase [Listeria costaricensis]|uniref:class I mannose-6-phosphate isomerase n=1 Tax=Listeria costaricensis TaxID=2026604 RepID=UPI000C087978|nr:class I mannose-6-phosphate isomerase [Listeria costaricensis]